MELDVTALAESIRQQIRELFPITRSITGDGVRQTLALLGREIPLDVIEVPSGTPVFDWIVPREWTFRDAYLKDGHGAKIVDASMLNLHVLNYSAPLHARLSRDDLLPYLLSDPDRPDVVPYRTSYYSERAGLCLSHRQLEGLADETYEIVIDTELAEGHLTYGECIVAGTTTAEILLSTHVCHPSLANDNCAGMALLATLMRTLSERSRSRPLRHTVRALFIPGTIGSITWLATHEHVLPRIRHGLVINNIGDDASFTYKRSRRGNAAIDRIAPVVLRGHEPALRVVDFEPYGYDERQFCSPGIDLAVGAISRSTYGYPEYHSSADNLAFVDPLMVARSLVAVAAIIDGLDNDRRYRNLSPKGEPQLGKRGLYSSVGGQIHGKQFEMGMLWLLAMSDGDHGLVDIAAASGLSIEVLASAVSALENAGLLEPID